MKKAYLLMTLILAVVLTAGCSRDDSGFSRNESGSQSSEEMEVKTLELRIFVPNEFSTALEERAVEIENPDNRSEAELILEALKDTGESSDYKRPIRKDIRLRGVSVKADTVYVDFFPDNLTGGSAEESIIIDSIVKSMLQIDGVKKVQLLVNGEAREFFMGTFYVDFPYTEENITNNIIYLEK